MQTTPCNKQINVLIVTNEEANVTFKTFAGLFHSYYVMSIFFSNFLDKTGDVYGESICIQCVHPNPSSCFFNH